MTVPRLVSGDGRLVHPVRERFVPVARATDLEVIRTAREHLARSREQYDAAVVEVTALRQAVAELDQQVAPIEEIEWYLLARLAGQRHVSFAGSMPLVIDRALDGVAPEGKAHLLDRLERMAGAVQVVHVTDDPDVLSWAEAAGEERVAIVRPVSPASTSDL